MTCFQHPFLAEFDSLDIIGNGSFGVIRKVRRKSDGMIFARKELNFERMTERDRKQIVAEVNILKDLDHEHIVRYHDRYVDREAGMLYILMEYCGGGDLSTVIKHASRSRRPIPEDTIWGYFYQILQALMHCHHPNGHRRTSSGNTVEIGPRDVSGTVNRPQILHRDLKPDNVFLDENNTVKLGDFGLSKALTQASFAHTYVGTPYYMSPELMQEKAYDSKSDIWALGCLIYELCALKPPFYEATTHTELGIFIKNGRIPPLPRGYSQALTSVIKSMLNLNPAMRPSAAQLLQHERLELVSRMQETDKMIIQINAHHDALAEKEEEMQQREAILVENERRLDSILKDKDQQICQLKDLLRDAYARPRTRTITASDPQVHALIRAAVFAREDELRVLVMEREAEVAREMERREAEILETVKSREDDVMELVRKREEEMAEALRAGQRHIEDRERRIEKADGKMEEVWAAAEKAQAEMKKDKENPFNDVSSRPGRKPKKPLEDVQNVLETLSREKPLRSHVQTRITRAPGSSTASGSSIQTSSSDASSPKQATAQLPDSHTPLFSPFSRPPLGPPASPTANRRPHALRSPMSPIGSPARRDTIDHTLAPLIRRGGLLSVAATRTPLSLKTPPAKPLELMALFEQTPRVGLDFGRIFDSGKGTNAPNGAEVAQAQDEKKRVEEENALTPNPSLRTHGEKSKSVEEIIDASKAAWPSSAVSVPPMQVLPQAQHRVLPLPSSRLLRSKVRGPGRSESSISPSSSSGSSHPAESASDSTHPRLELEHPGRPKPSSHARIRPPTPGNKTTKISGLEDDSDDDLPRPFIKRAVGTKLHSEPHCEVSAMAKRRSERTGVFTSSSSNSDNAKVDDGKERTSTYSTQVSWIKPKRRPSTSLFFCAAAVAAI